MSLSASFGQSSFPVRNQSTAEFTPRQQFPLPGPKSQDLPHLEALSRTLLPQPLRRLDGFRLVHASADKVVQRAAGLQDIES